MAPCGIALAYCRSVFEIEANSAVTNPLVFSEGMQSSRMVKAM